MATKSKKNLEEQRLDAARESGVTWKKWGPYLSERQWGTVREDYSSDGNAWDYFSHDQSRSRTYRWGEDGIAGISDDHQLMCFSVALWNGRDPILKERLFGLTNSEGNHGEDCKEYYFYLDSTPTHSYMKYLYKYPQAEFPYRDLVQTNRSRSRHEMEYELLDTGVFHADRYFDVFVEYAKDSPDDLQVRISVHNRGPENATVHILPTLWFRNTWTYGDGGARPSVKASGKTTIDASHASVGDFSLQCYGADELLFTENESNNQRLWNQPNETPYVKDAFHRYLINGETGAVNPAQTGTKAAARYAREVPAGGSVIVKLSLGPTTAKRKAESDIDAIFKVRLDEANVFYQAVIPDNLTEDQKNVERQAFAGMLWGKQFYYFDVDRWLAEHDSHPLMDEVKAGIRNLEWFHMLNQDVISMPDKWEYPWYAAWDLAFHTIALSRVDFDFAKQQLLLMLRNLYFHPNGQIPAYEWNFSDVNPPVHAWATLQLFRTEQDLGREDLSFLEHSFHGLMLNFNWWVNRKDPEGRNVFAGGFLGLDNIGVFDRSSKLPTGGSLEQADGTAWMAFYSQMMLEIALILAERDPIYEEAAFKFVHNFLCIAYAMDRIGDCHDEMWDEEDGFYYDLLRLPNGDARRLKVRSMVGLLPLCASTVFEANVREKYPKLMEMIELFRKRNPEIMAQIAPPDGVKGYKDRRILSLMNRGKLERVLNRLLDENEFLGPYGIRSLSRYHEANPFRLNVEGQEYTVNYLPAESDTGMFGGNSNWRGPVWMPVNILIIRGLLNLYMFYGNDLKVECPVGSGKTMNLFEVAGEIARRLSAIFLRNAEGKRPVYGGAEKFQDDPYWKDHILFYEYFHGDNGAGLGASHQTGWTGLIAPVLDLFARNDANSLLEHSKTDWKYLHETVRG